MDQLWDHLYLQLNKKVHIPHEEWRYFQTLAVYQVVHKHQHFVQAGAYSDFIGLCIDGLFRLYYTTPDGVEFNKNFCSKFDFVASYSAILQEVPSYFSIQAMTDSHLITFRHRDLQSLYTRHICWEQLGRHIAEQLFVNKEIRERELLMLSAESRYRLFLSRFSDLSDQIPQYHIASYLGITPVALSRIRRKINLS